jgi:hypothetical protein
MRYLQGSETVTAFAVLALLSALNAPAQTDPVRYYIQLVRGTDGVASTPAGVRKVGPKLERQFHRMFRDKAYWEITCRQLNVAPGHSCKIELDNGREVEISLTSTKRTVTTFFKGQLVDRARIPRGEAMTVIGSGQEEGNSWFVVVRRDKPVR